jgi:hypothetical protein
MHEDDRRALSGRLIDRGEAVKTPRMNVDVSASEGSFHEGSIARRL